MSNQNPEFKISNECSTFCVHCANECDERMVEYDPNTTAQDRENDQKIAEQNALAEDRMYAEQTRLALEESDRHKAELIAGLKECERIATEEKRPEDATAWKVIRDILESEGVMYGDNIEKMNAELARIAKKHLNTEGDDSDAIEEAERRMGADGTDEHRRDITGKNDLSPDFYGDEEGADEGE